MEFIDFNILLYDTNKAICVSHLLYNVPDKHDVIGLCWPEGALWGYGGSWGKIGVDQCHGWNK